MSRITAAGPAPKRPPHNELEVELRVVIGTLLLASLYGCGNAVPGDKGKPEKPQATAAPASGTPVLSVIDRSHAGTPAPTVAFEQKSGKSMTLADFKGKTVLVNLWATWCVPCVAEMPDLDRLAAAQAGRLTVLPISQDMEGWQVVDKFFKPGRFTALQPYLDQPTAFAVKMDAKGLPLSILYGPDGKEKWRVNGPLKWLSPDVAAALA